METDAKIWGIHAGANSEANGLFLNKKNPCIAIGWGEIGDLSKLKPNRETYKKVVREKYPELKDGAIPARAGVLFRFVNEMQIGDLVVYPSKVDRHIHIGEIIGDYSYDAGKVYQNIRSVKWREQVSRTYFSQGALSEMGSALTLFQIKNYAEDEILAALAGQGPQRILEVDTTIANVEEDIEQNTKDFILKRLVQELKGHPFEDFVAHLLNIIGYKTRISPVGADGGIDIIAHKDALGLEPPIIKVQVKSIDADVTPEKVQALYGNVSAGEYGLFVALNGYSKKAIEFAKSKTNLRIINGDELIEIILQYYEKLDSKYKAIIPLKNVYIPVQVEND